MTSAAAVSRGQAARESCGHRALPGVRFRVLRPIGGAFLFPFLSKEIGLTNTKPGIITGVVAVAWALFGTAVLQTSVSATHRSRPVRYRMAAGPRPGRGRWDEVVSRVPSSGTNHDISRLWRMSALPDSGCPGRTGYLPPR